MTTAYNHQMECCKKSVFFLVWNYTIIWISPHLAVSIARKHVFFYIRFSEYSSNAVSFWGFVGAIEVNMKKSDVNQTHGLRLHWTSNYLWNQVVGLHWTTFICTFVQPTHYIHFVYLCSRTHSVFPSMFYCDFNSTRYFICDAV